MTSDRKNQLSRQDESLIDSATVQAYIDTDYLVYAAPPFSLRIGVQSEALTAVQLHHRVDCSAYITACNPFSKLLDESTNAQRHELLRRELEQQYFSFLEGVGQQSSGQWPGEFSFLVLGLPLEEAKALGIRLEQNAIVWAGADATPRLILLR